MKKQFGEEFEVYEYDSNTKNGRTNKLLKYCKLESIGKVLYSFIFF